MTTKHGRVTVTLYKRIDQAEKCLCICKRPVEVFKWDNGTMTLEFRTYADCKRFMQELSDSEDEPG